MRLIDADKLRERICDSLDFLEKNESGWVLSLGIAVEFLDEAPTIPQWIRCEDEMPKHDESVLCCGGRGGMFVGKVCTNSGTKNGRAAVVLPNGDVRYCTHWMPLPELPKEDSNEID